METISRLKAIREYFGNVPIGELKALSEADRYELAVRAAKELGKKLEAPQQNR